MSAFEPVLLQPSGRKPGRAKCSLGCRGALGGAWRGMVSRRGAVNVTTEAHGVGSVSICDFTWTACQPRHTMLSLQASTWSGWLCSCSWGSGRLSSVLIDFCLGGSCQKHVMASLAGFISTSTGSASGR